MIYHQKQEATRLELNYAIELYDYIISTFMRKILMNVVDSCNS